MKKILALVLALCMVLSLAACGASKPAETPAETPVETPAETPTETPAEKPVLYVANWQGYCSDEPYAEQAFEELYNCEVEHVYFNTLEELFTTLQTGGVGNIDAVCSTNNYTKAYMDAGLLQPIDLSKCPNYADVAEDYLAKDSCYDADGNCYGLPWVWSINYLGYNGDLVDRELNSWSDIWDDEFAGKVGIGDDYVIFMMMTAMALGMEPSSVENIDLEKVEAALIDLKPNVNVIWSSYDEFISPYNSGEVVIGDPWCGMATTLRNAGANIKYVPPVEGTVGTVDMWSVVKGSKNYDLAVAWCDFMCGVEFQTAMATAEGNAHNPVNTKVIASLTPEQLDVLWCNPMPENIYMILALDDAQKEAWSEIWNYFKAY